MKKYYSKPVASSVRTKVRTSLLAGSSEDVNVEASIEDMPIEVKTRGNNLD